MKELRIKERMTAAEKKEFGEDHPHRIEYAYGAVFEGQSRTPILLKSRDFWMPLARAKRIHRWLGLAIKHAEKLNKKKVRLCRNSKR